MATRIRNLQVIKVVDGDTVKVALNGKTESLRLICVDTEESQPGGSKPVTAAGKESSEMAKKYFATAGGGLAKVDIEFDTDDPIEVAVEKHRDNYGRVGRKKAPNHFYKPPDSSVGSILKSKI